jgi:hypothetical protein
MEWDNTALQTGADRLFHKARGWQPIPPHLYPKERTFLNLRGVRRGGLVFEEYLGKLQKNRTGRWLVKCDCGRHTIMHASTQTRCEEDYRCDICYSELMKRKVSNEGK